ncbi:unnamed protein product [Aureobasidium mustum]|uniref:BTB domain-containing protein n=1 Tax=Aureobasidium mustum TaxID=2773714 RepID=A0A9N8JNE3_9PEZI|nr:unnamed protein product [Aureobasidium mustum]
MPPGAPALHRGLARPSALASHLSRLSCRRRLFQTNAPASRSTKSLAAGPIANIDHVRQELENAHKGSRNLPSRSAFLPGPSHTERKNFLARLTSWMPLFHRLQTSPDAFSTLRYEADVCNRLPPPSSGETRLVDQPQYLQNVNLWLELLRFRLRLDGQQGAVDVVQAIVQRQVILPTRGPLADQLWSTLLWSAVQYPKMLNHLYPYLVESLPRSALLDIGLYTRLVGPLLRHNPMFAATWHKRLQADGLIPLAFVSVLAQFITDVCSSNHKSRAVEAFKKIYTSAKVEHAYDECMLPLCRLFDFSDALDMHAFFIRHDDHPSPSMQSMPVIAHLTEHSWLAKSNMKQSVRSRFTTQILEAQYGFNHLKPAELDVPRAEATMLSLTRESMSNIVGDVHNIREKELNDAFCARLFATTAFSIDLIITGLRMLGLKAVGNLALREIAARAPSPAEYMITIDAVKSAGISVVDSVFSRALRSFASRSDKYQSFEFLITSDQHPTAYEDRILQKQLFASFLASGDHSQANAVLDILTIHQPQPEHYHANLILQTYASSGQRASTMQILHEMRLHRIPVSDASLRILQWTSLRPRLRSKRPISQRHDEFKDDLDFTTNVFLETMRTGQPFDPTRWHEILRRYGMENRLEPLERLSMWLALWYSGRIDTVDQALGESLPQGQGPAKAHATTPSKDNQHPLAAIFTPHLLRAIVAWGFKSEASSTESATSIKLGSSADSDNGSQNLESELSQLPKDWTRGLALVHNLDRLGVNIRGKDLRREVKLRLWILYGPGKSTFIFFQRLHCDSSFIDSTTSHHSFTFIIPRLLDCALSVNLVNMPPSSTSRKRTHYSYLQSPMITVCVGPEKKEFGVHKALICKRSTFFDKALNGRSAEANTRIVRLEQVPVPLFSIFVSWLYYGELPMMLLLTATETSGMTLINSCVRDGDKNTEHEGQQEQDQISVDTATVTAGGYPAVGREDAPGNEPKQQGLKHKNIKQKSSKHKIPKRIHSLYEKSKHPLSADNTKTWPVDIIAKLYMLGDFLDAKRFKIDVLDAVLYGGDSLDDDEPPYWNLPSIPSRPLIRLVYKNTPSQSPLRDLITNQMVYGYVWIERSHLYEDLPSEFLAAVMVGLGHQLSDVLDPSGHRRELFDEELFDEQ